METRRAHAVRTLSYGCRQSTSTWAPEQNSVAFRIWVPKDPLGYVHSWCPSAFPNFDSRLALMGTKCSQQNSGPVPAPVYKVSYFEYQCLNATLFYSSARVQSVNIAFRWQSLAHVSHLELRRGYKNGGFQYTSSQI